MIEIRDIHKTYRMGNVDVKALDGVSLSIAPGEFVAIMGPSGSGKSTLMHMLGLLDRPQSGQYLLMGKQVTGLTEAELARVRNRLIGFVFQQFHLLPRMTALDNAELPLVYAGKRHLSERARKELSTVGLGERLTHRPGELSGGQQQRVAIARALVNEPPILLADEPTGNLDSRSKGEIMGILKQLNAMGKTVIIVTHEQEVAEQCRRIIRMNDGKIVSDRRLGGDDGKDEENPAVGVEAPLELHRSSTGGIQFLDYLRQAFSAMVSHKMRSFLSILGILIGVAAVIAMLALGTGAKESIEQQLSSLGSNLLMLRSGSSRHGGVSLATGTVTRLTFSDLAALEKIGPEVKSVMGSVSGRGQMVYGNKNWNTQVEGTGAEYPEMRSSVPVVGRFFTEQEVRSREKVAVLGLTVARELFGESNPVGETIKLNLLNFKVVGVLPSKGASSWHDQDDVVVIPITTAMYRVFGKQYIDSIFVQAADARLVGTVEEAVSQAIVKQHRLSEDEEESFQVRNMSEIKDALESTTRTMSLLLGAIAAISLLVGGIGIMNIMLVSVTERTREIGLRKAIGANNKDILVQFLIESVLMSLTGGLVGVLLGVGIAVLFTVVAGWAAKVSMFSVVLSTVFSLAVGMVFGLWPAKKAAGLDPIEALRYE